MADTQESFPQATTGLNTTIAQAAQAALQSTPAQPAQPVSAQS